MNNVETINNTLLDYGISTIVSPTQVEFIIEIDDYRLGEVRQYKYYGSRKLAWEYGANNIIRNLEKYLKGK